MDLEELEEEIRMHRRGHHQEMVIIGVVVAVLAIAVVAILVYVF